jgi:hypothetical protein
VDVLDKLQGVFGFLDSKMIGVELETVHALGGQMLLKSQVTERRK